jgi:uncharacterized lipoprotein YmbA
MKTAIHPRKLLLVTCLLALVLAGCLGASRPVDFYTLTPLLRPTGGPDAAPGTIIAVPPVVIPQYIDRPQIVTRTDDNQIALSEFNRWGGTLKDELTRVLVENLSILLVGRGANVMIDILALDPTYLVTVTVNRFDGQLGDTVWLNAAWTIRDQKAKKMLAVKTSAIQEKAAAQGYNALVTAESRAVAALSREIAAELSALLKTTP